MGIFKKTLQTFFNFWTFLKMSIFQKKFNGSQRFFSRIFNGNKNNIVIQIFQMENGFFIIKGWKENDSMMKNHEVIEYYKLIINIL
jgi:hypothetical protein